MKILFRLCKTVLFSALLFSCTAQSKTSLSVDEFEKEIAGKENIQILDVRTPGEFFSGHIKNALQADWNDKKSHRLTSILLSVTANVALQKELSLK